MQSNPFLPGQLYASNDPGAIPDAMSCGFTVIALVDVSSTPNYKNCAVISSLLPPPDAISCILDGNLQLGQQKYLAYLADSAREDTVVCILAALHQHPRNFLLYTEYDPDQEFHILETLRTFFFQAFGIIIGDYKNPKLPAGSINDPRYNFTLADLLFINGYIPKEMYVGMLPPNAVPSPRAISILLRHINYGFQTMDECVKACMAMIENTRREIQTGMINPVMVVPPQLSKEALEELNRRKMGQVTMDATTKANSRYG